VSDTVAPLNRQPRALSLTESPLIRGRFLLLRLRWIAPAVPVAEQIVEHGAVKRDLAAALGMSNGAASVAPCNLSL
jgi:hypothetical protein